MKRLLAAIAVLILFMSSADATYRYPIYKAPAAQPSQPNPAQGHFQTFQSVLYFWGSCALVSQGIDTFIVHEVYKRKRNEADQLAAFLCLPGQGHRFAHLFANRPRELYFYSEVNRKPAGAP